MELVEVALTVRTALGSGVAVPTVNWSFVESQRKSADPEMDEDVSQKVTCPACPPVTVEGHAPSTHARCPPSARRIPPPSGLPSNVDVEFCPFTFMNPAKVEVAPTPLTFKTAPMVEEEVTSNVPVTVESPVMSAPPAWTVSCWPEVILPDDCMLPPALMKTVLIPANVELAVFAVSCPWTVVDAIAVMGPRMVVDPVFETEKLVEVALTVRTALVSGVSVPTVNWSFVESQRKSADPEMDEDVSQKVTCPACPPVTVEGHAPSTHARCPPSARRIPPPSGLPSNVDVEFCPFTFMNPAKVEVAPTP